MLLTVVQGTAQGVSVFAQTREKLEGTLVSIVGLMPLSHSRLQLTVNYDYFLVMRTK